MDICYFDTGTYYNKGIPVNIIHPTQSINNKLMLKAILSRLELNLVQCAQIQVFNNTSQPNNHKKGTYLCFKNLVN